MSREILKPVWAPIWLWCKKCGKPWDDWQPQNVPIATWAAHVKTYRCPHCGAGGRNVLLRTKATDDVRA